MLPEPALGHGQAGEGMPRFDRKPVKTLSLFTGAGGLDLGFHAAGFDIVACVEIDRSYCSTLLANKGPGKTYGVNTQILHDDVRKFRAADFAGQGIECIIGGKYPLITSK